MLGSKYPRVLKGVKPNASPLLQGIDNQSIEKYIDKKNVRTRTGIVRIRTCAG
jgi:hypothetical protein